ncbi:MAG TPA: hypothetical protein VFT01_04265 [Homoserinimonas sp.]|nr:hypothetical protein [Homoserinimonas sp.]
MSSRRALPPELRGTPFPVHEALTAGVTPTRLRAADLESPFHGIRRPVTPLLPDTSDSDELQRRRLAQLVSDCRSYLTRADPAALFSHVTAARLYRMPLPWALETRPELDVAVLDPAHPPRRSGIVGHRLNAGSIAVTSIGGLPVPSAVDVWLQLGPLLSVKNLIIAADHLVRRKQPFTTLGTLHEAVDALHRHRGAARLRAALPYIRSKTDSPAESRMRLILIAAGLPEPVIGHTVYDKDGFFVGTPDLAYVGERIALDYEGEVHNRDARVFGEDIERREQFQDAGWRHIRVVKGHLAKPHRLVDRVSFALAERRTSIR